MTIATFDNRPLDIRATDQEFGGLLETFMVQNARIEADYIVKE